jgi:hypothetical protein
MGGIMSSPKAAQPSAAQVEAQETQKRLAEAEAARLERATTEAEAARRARAGGRAGRSLLLNTDTGISDEDRAPKTTLGG